MTEALGAFRRIQAGKESSAGTAVAATVALLGVMATIESGEVFEQPDEDRNTLAANVADDFQVGVETHLAWTGDVNFQHIAWPLAMAIRGNVSGAATDSQYLYTFTPALTTPNTPDQTNGIDTFTFEYGDNLQAYEAEFCFATRLEISGAPNQPCKFTCDITARQQSDTTFTGALSYSAVQRAPFNLAKFYIDTTGAGIGTTQKTGLLKGFTWVLETMFVPRYTADGNLYFTRLDEDKKKPVLTLTYARNSDSDAERTKYEARTTTFIRIELNGATEMDEGVGNTPYLALDQAVRYMVWPSWGEENGLSTVQVTAEGVYDSTWTKMFEALLFTDLAAII